MFEVSIHEAGKVMVAHGAHSGLLQSRNRWVRITPRPIGRQRAEELANAQPTHAVVNAWGSAEVVYDNGKPPTRPEGWWPLEAKTCQDPK